MSSDMKIAIFFVGEVEDAGFNASALAGVDSARADGLADLTVISGVSYDQAEIRARMTKAMKDCNGLIFIGGQGNLATPDIAQKWPDKSFAIVQGNQTGPNLASYDVQQEESAFLAGCLAARLTKTGIVGHLSGHRVPPGLKGRAAFAAGVAHADRSVQVLTGFCGTQDDSAVTYCWARAEIDAGADILFTMLNGARAGAIKACKETGVRQIGNALNWVDRTPEIFVASAIARIDIGVKRAVEDMVAGTQPSEVAEFGLADGDFVTLALHSSVPNEIAVEMNSIARAIRNGLIPIPTHFDGDEFEPGDVECDTAT